MSSKAGTLEQLASALGQALTPLEDLLATGQVLGLFSELGVAFPAALTAQGAFATALQNAVNAAAQLPPLITQMESAIESDEIGQILQAGTGLVNSIKALIQNLNSIATGLPAAATAAGFSAADATAFATQLVQKLFSYTIVRYLENYHAALLYGLTLTGLIDRDQVASSGPTQPAYTNRSLRFDRLGDFITNPAKELLSVYDWGDPGFNGSELLSRLHDTFAALSLPVFLNSQANPPALVAFFLTIAPKLDINPPGMQVSIQEDIPGGFSVQFPLGTSGLALELVLDADLKGRTSIVLQPPGSFTVTPPGGSVSGSALVGIVKSAVGGGPIVIVGVTGGSGLSASQIKLEIGASLEWNSASNSAQGDFEISFEIDKGNAAIDTSQADGFLADVLSGVNVQAGFDLNATWRLGSGLHITGGAQLEVDLPLHLDLGPVTLPTLYLIGGLANNAITLEVSAALGITLGPIQGSVDRVGLLGTLTFPQSGGNLGPANLQLAFKPPNGLGLAVDAGLVTGGGYISFDPSKGQYAGILQLSLVDTIGITVIGVLDTIMPDGSSGFSFLLIITFTLPPIELGFGFTLNGVGGLGGVNRTMDTNALQAGFRAHTLDSVMFPVDPIANSAQIISNIRSFFPVAQGRYLFGPLLQIGWGEPTLITFTLGVILSVPDPIVIAILGLIDAGLPTEDEALLELHIEVLGIINFGTKTLSIDGSMYDSSILIYALAGDLALRLSWGSNPNFLYSLGGFNPNFNTNGLNVPQMARLSVSIGDGDNPRISSDSYFAVTSNTVQFGADVQAYASAGGFAIQGYLGFDVLIIISPFSFEFDFTASFDVSYDGANLLGLNVDGVIQGPTPWHFHGSASISILWWTVSASVDLTWGSSTQATIPSQPVLPDLETAFQNPQSWSAALPPATTVGVSLATPSPNNKILCVHPMGTLQVKEKVVPLDLPITKYGNATPSDGTEFSIQSVQINGQTETIQPVTDYFAPGQFLTLSDADKLSSPSFALQDAGVTIGSSAILNGQNSPRTVVYEEYYIYDPSDFSMFSRLYAMPANIHLALSAQGAGFASQVKNTGLQKYSTGVTTPAINVTDPQYVVTSVDDLSIRADIVPGGGTSYFGAKAALSTYLSANPTETGNLQIMPAHEVAA